MMSLWFILELNHYVVLRLLKVNLLRGKQVLCRQIRLCSISTEHEVKKYIQYKIVP